MYIHDTYVEPRFFPRMEIFLYHHIMSLFNYYRCKDFRGILVVKTPCFHCKGHGFGLWLRLKFLHAVWQGQKKISYIVGKVLQVFYIYSHLILTSAVK